MNLNLFLTIVWTIFLGTDINGYMSGAQPTWPLLFVTDICLILKCLADYLEDKYVE
jgi:hypothetical protein